LPVGSELPIQARSKMPASQHGKLDRQVDEERVEPAAESG
jgi:hypothetical protein